MKKRKIIFKEMCINDKQIIEMLKKVMDAITAEDDLESAEKEVEKNMVYYINKLAERHGWEPRKMDSFLCKLHDLYPVLPAQMVLKEIALDLDMKYEGHISKAEHIFVISLANGEIVELHKDKIKNFKNFSAFRTVEDAQFAKQVLNTAFRVLYE